MYPYLLPEVFGYVIPLYDVMIGIGVIAMLAYVATRFEKRDGVSRENSNRLLILIAVSLLIALGSSWVFDGLFHSLAEGELAFGSITFLGGLIGGIVAFVILYKFFYKAEDKNLKVTLNTIITGVVLAHAFGRIGCFFAGCCFGVPTDSFLGVVFPHGHAHDLYPDSAVWPTQLFESAFLFGLFFFLHNYKKVFGKEALVYMVGYGSWRFLIEFIRGDERGVLVPLWETQYNTFPTPSQFMSFLMIIAGLYLLFHRQKQKIV
jgi:phosphatidylglycerol:prolipoprotein diacylglycerol transferase